MKRAKMSTIKVIDYTRNPGARYISDGLYSGEEYFNLVLNVSFEMAVAKKERLIVDLDGTSGYASSFLSEAFGLLAERYGVEKVLKNIELISNEEPDWKIAILKNYIPNATKRKKKSGT